MTKYIRRLAALLLVFLLPGAVLADGVWRTVTGELTDAELLIPASEYTGEIRITFLGDCTLGGESPARYPRLSFETRIEENGMAFPFRELIRLTGEDDLTIANLEGVLSDNSLTKVQKQYNFIGTTAYTEILREGSVECVTLANNHSHDFGDKGYKDTKEAVENAGVCWFGVDAPAIWRSDNGLKIGFLGVSGSLSGNRAKAYETQAAKLKSAGCAAIITVMHAGTEYSYEPPDGYQNQITGYATKVSDLIIGHHPHVVQGYDVVDGVPVVYSLGNCIFGGNTHPKDFDAMVVQAVLHFREGSLEKTDLHFYPISVSSDSHYNNYSPQFLTGTDADRVLRKLEKSTGKDPGTFSDIEGAVVSFDAKGE